MKPKFGLMVLSLLVIGAALSQTLAQDVVPGDVPGRIAIINEAFNVEVVDPATGDVVALTQDASPTRHYQWPTWSTDGRLAYFCCDLSVARQAGDAEVYISQDAAEPGKLIYQTGGEAFTYAYWSPSNCAGGGNCRELAVLLSQFGAGAFKVEIIRDDRESPSSRTVGTGAPYYYSWSADGQQMIWQRNNESIDLYDAVGDVVLQTLPVRAGIFPAPAWSPADGRALFGTFNAANRSTDLSIIDNSEVRVLRADLPGAVAFSWSPDSARVAYRTLTREEGAGPLVLLDAATGEEVARSSAGVLGFFWSPDSGRIAYLTLSPAQGSPSAEGREGIVSAANDRSSLAAQNQVATLDWIIWDIATDAELRVARFVPTTEMIYLISYFDQFNQSHRLWSPDSRYLVYAEETISGQPTVNILDTTTPNAVPFAVAGGRIGIWSYD